MVSGDGVTLMDEGDDFKDSPYDTPSKIVLYSIKKNAEVQLRLEYIGAYPIEGSVWINGIARDVFEKTVTIDRAEAMTTGPSFFTVGATVITGQEERRDAEGQPYMVDILTPIQNQFAIKTQFWKPLDVKIVNPTGGYNFRIESSSVTPKIVNGGVVAQYSALPDVGVKMVKGDESLLEFTEAWFRTDEYGSAAINFLGPLEAGNYTNGWLSEAVTLNAAKNGVELETTKSVGLPFARVESAVKVWLIDDLGSEVLEPIYPGYYLTKGQIVQIGTELVGGQFSVEYANGQKVVLSAETFGGFRATIGEGDTTQGYTLIWLNFRQKLQDWHDMPQRCLRMQIYKKIAGVLDTALGIPDSAGWVTETPGGALEKWMAKWGEAAYQTSGRQPQLERSACALSEPIDGQPMMLSEPLATQRMQATGMNESAHVDISFNTDGSVYFENMAGSVQLNRDGVAMASLAPSTAVLVYPSPNSYHSVLTAPATSTTAWNAPESVPWIFSPADGETLFSRTPELSINMDADNGLVSETCRIRLDDRDVTDWFLVDSSMPTGRVPSADPLDSGLHTLTLRCTALNGEQVSQSVSFVVNALPAETAYLQATSFSNGVWLSWQAVPQVAGYRVWRAAAVSGGKTELTSMQRTQPGFLDQAPLSTNVYWIETIDAVGLHSLMSNSTSCAWNSSLPAAPSVGDVQGLSCVEVPQGVKIQFDESAKATARWELARATAETGPFARLAADDETLAEGYIDRQVLPGTTYFYRLTPMQLDGTADTPHVASITAGSVPGSVTGFNGYFSGTSAQLQWNPLGDFRANGLRIYRSTDGGQSYQLRVSVAATNRIYADSEITVNTPYLYQIRSFGSGGEAGSVSVGLMAYSIAEQEAIINFQNNETRLPEGAGEVHVPVTRSGNLGESACIRYETEYMGSAETDVDFKKTTGTLVFDVAQTDAEIVVPLLADAVHEDPENFRLRMWGAYGAATGSNTYTSIILDESDIILMADYQSEITVNETNPQVFIWVERALPSQREVSIEVALSAEAGTAVAGVDYVAFVPQRLVFATNEIRKAFAIGLLADGVKDGEKQLNVELRSPLGGACLDAGFSAQTVKIRDNETHPGQIAPVLSSSILVVPKGQNSIQIPVERLGGTDDSIGSFIDTMGGPLPWGSISVSPSSLTFAEGVTSTVLTVTLDRSGLDPRIAPFGVLNIVNTSYPNETHQVVLLFSHDEPTTPAYESWIANYSVGGQTAVSDDPDGDGVINLVEFALGTRPDQASSRPESKYNIEGGLQFSMRINPDPRLAVIGEFCSDLVSGEKTYSAGWWSWDDERELFSADYYQSDFGINRLFGRLKFIWLGD